MTEPSRPDIKWCRSHLAGFKKWEADVEFTKSDEQRYRQHPGYVPALVVKEEANEQH